MLKPHGLVSKLGVLSTGKIFEARMGLGVQGGRGLGFRVQGLGLTVSKLRGKGPCKRCAAHLPEKHGLISPEFQSLSRPLLMGLPCPAPRYMGPYKLLMAL